MDAKGPEDAAPPDEAQGGAAANAERRTSGRIPVDMWVEETGAEGLTFRRSGNLSIGGLRLDHSVPLPLGTVLDLSFTLPGDGEPIRVSGTIVSQTGTDGFAMGVKFTSLVPEAAARIEAFVDRVARAAPSSEDGH